MCHIAPSFLDNIHLGRLPSPLYIRSGRPSSREERFRLEHQLFQEALILFLPPPDSKGVAIVVPPVCVQHGAKWQIAGGVVLRGDIDAVLFSGWGFYQNDLLCVTEEARFIVTTQY